MVNIYVLGGGVTGLNFAREVANKDFNVIVLEKNKRWGGLAGYVNKFDRNLDLGPHIFHTPDEDIKNYLLDSFPDLFHERDHWSKNLKNCQYFDYPISEDFINSLDINTREKIYSELDNRDETKAAEATTYREYIDAIAGTTLRKLFFEQYPSKLWGTTTDKLDANWAPKRVQIRKQKMPFYGDQWAAVGIDGTSSIIDSLVQQNTERGVSLKNDEEILHIEVEDNFIRSINTSKENYIVSENDIVINTLSLSVYSGLIGQKFNVKYRGVCLAYVHTTNIKPFPDNVDFIYVDDMKIIFNRVSDQNTFVKEINQSSTVLCCEITYSKGDSLSLLSDIEIGERVSQDLVNLGILSKTEILDTYIVKLDEVYPMFDLDYRKNMNTAMEIVNKPINIYTLGSLAEFAYSDLQILFAKSKDLANMIKSSTSKLNRTYINKPSNIFNQKITFFDNYIESFGRCFTIAEIGLNHNGDINLAKELMDNAKIAGFDAVKLQTYKSEGRSAAGGSTSKYVEKIIGTELTDNEMFSKYELSEAQHIELFKYANEIKMPIFSAPFDNESVDLLEQLGVQAYKIASMELTNLELIRYVAQKNKPMIISTGMATISDIEDALSVCSSVGNKNVVVLHCTSIYPAPAGSINLKAIETINRCFKIPTGFSDHYPGSIMSYASIAFGCCVIEKHVTSNKHLEGPDHALSLDYSEQHEFINNLREMERAIGSGVKRPSKEELKSEVRFKKSFYFAKDLVKGQVIKEEDLVLKAPCFGLLPKYKDLIIGSKVAMEVNAGCPVTLEALSHEY